LFDETQRLRAELKFNTTPPQRQWAGLTDEEITELSDFVYAGDPQYVRLIESKLREKNMT
jgi:hypothetical protein